MSEQINTEPTQKTAVRPEDVPAKFWDEKSGEVRLDALLKSYLDLERHMGHVEKTVPGDAKGYEIKVDHGLLDVDDDVNARLHEAGFSNEQAQTVYDLAAEYLLPMVEGLSEHFDAQRQQERLAEHFGGEETFAEISRQLKAWGQANLPEDTYEALSGTFEGVLALHAMMEKGEPSLGKGQAGAEGALDENALRALMKDPRYWKDRDPATVARVRDGFKRLYDA